MKPQTFKNKVTAIENFYPLKETDKRIDAFCECCSEQDRGTRQELESRGWGLYPKHQFCPRHEQEI